MLLKESFFAMGAAEIRSGTADARPGRGGRGAAKATGLREGCHATGIESCLRHACDAQPSYAGAGFPECITLPMNPVDVGAEAGVVAQRQPRLNADGPLQRLMDGGGLDRKSTRLNSSH